MEKIALAAIKSQLNKDIKNKFDELEAEKAKFIEAACIFCVDWIHGYIERKVFQYNLQVSKKLGLKLKEFKHEVDEFCQEVPELVRKEFSKKIYWQHYETSETNAVDPDKFKSSYHFNGVSSPQILDLGIRMASGKLGLILKKYGYLYPEKDPTDQWEEKSGAFCYPFLLLRYWPKDLGVIAENYAIALDKFQELNFKLSEIIRKENEQNVKMNWF
jgi:hypothetical protein